MRPFLYQLLLLSALIVATSTGANAQFPAPCDANKACIGNALLTQVTSGRNAQYVDVDTSYRLAALNTALTFEAWIKPQEQPGMRQFVGGLWGPNRDDNDQWVVYIEGTRIYFELSADGTKLESADNTIASVDVPDLYTRGWVHVAAVWESSGTAQLFVNGFQAATGTNPAYPVTRLHPVANRNLQTQIGSCNGLYDDANRYRTFLGQIDEVRIWSRALTANEIRCQKDLSLNGNENGLVLYYRFNEAPTGQALCDATGHGIVGRMRSGARCEASNRTVPFTFSVAPTSFSGTIICTGDTTFTVTVTDTSFCAGQVVLQVAGRDAGLFTVTPNRLTLQQNAPQSATVRMRATITGQLQAELRVFNNNRCNNIARIPINFTRKTDFEYSEGQIDLDTLYVGCVEKPFAEKPLTLTNITNRPLNIDSIRLNDTVFKWSPAIAGQNLPLTVPPGGSWTMLIRMNAGDTTRTNYDTLRLFSDDRCPGSGIIPLVGHTQEVLLLLKEDGSKIDSMSFGPVCPGQISDVRTYQYRSGVSDPIGIDTIEFDDGFFGRRFRFPIMLQPQEAYNATFVRFRPTRSGNYTGEMRVKTRYKGCTIVKKVFLKGYGIDVNFVFNQSIIGFGNVTIGKTATQAVTVENRGDPRRLSAYLKIGDVFRIAGGRSLNLAKGRSGNVTVEFRPREAITYYDTLCIFDEECYGVVCIPISGTGVFDALSFQPSYLSISNVVGCRCGQDSITITNASAGPLTITSATLNDPTGKYTKVSGISSGTLQPGESTIWTLRYCPNDLADDRADQAFIDVNLSDGQRYQVLIRGTSTTPKLYVTPLTTYGLVEVGTTRTDRILVENISTVPVEVDTLYLPPGYSIIATTRPFPATLQPRDSILVDVQFAPTQETAYNGNVRAVSSNPCAIQQVGSLTGQGIIYRLDVPLSFINYGLVRPCDCIVREIPLPNQSAFKPITVDSIWIDGRNVANAIPAVYSWRSKLTGARTLPYQIPPSTTDTLEISFCPNIPATQQNLLANGKFHIRSHTTDWNREDTVTMSGRRELNFQPAPTPINFPNTRAGTTSPNRTVTVTVPDQFVNPSGDSMIVTGIRFVPDQQVFAAAPVNGAPFPWVIKRGDTFRIRVNFTPRAPRPYQARMYITTSYPCNDDDTTVLVRGEGFAFPYGMRMTFDTVAATLDTITITTCDTLRLPVITDRDMPQDRIDVRFRIQYDSTIVSLGQVSSSYTNNITAIDTGDGARVTLRNALQVPADTIAWVTFIPRTGDTIFKVHIDEVDFDSDTLVLYKLVVPPDSIYIQIAQPRIAVSSLTSFDTVNLKSCADRVLAVTNPGKIPVEFNALRLPPGHTVVGSSVPYPTQLAPGDTVLLTVRFCPFVEQLYDTAITAESNLPCPIADTGRIYSFGYAPPFPFRFTLDTNVSQIDTIGGVIADTIEVGIYSDRDIAQMPLDVGFALNYNRRALQFLSISSPYSAAVSATEGTTGIRVSIPGCDSVQRGELARARFAVAVPDSIRSPMHLAVLATDFSSDSIFFVKLIPTGDTSIVQVDPRCNISRLNFRGGLNRLTAPSPNPTKGIVTIEVEFFEDANARLGLFNSAGVQVAKLMDGRQLLPGGRYRVELNTADLPQGSYFYILEANNFRATERMEVVR